ncbi:hypothetical protein NL108_002313, partial [Boleophthalmus pectinirostris]
GVITNTGGKVIVKKMAGQSIYKGSNSNGVRSLSLPKWRESFAVYVGKPKKGVIYPSTLDYVPSRPTYVKPIYTKLYFSGQKEVKTQVVSTPPPPTTPEPTTTTTTPEPTTTQTTTEAPTTTTAPPTTTTTKARAAVHKVRDAERGHTETPQTQKRFDCGPLRLLHLLHRCDPCHYTPIGTALSNMSLILDPAGLRRQETSATIRRQPSSPVGPVEPVDAWKPDINLYESGFNLREPEPIPRIPEPVSQGDPNCKVDLVFLMDGSWSIGKRRFKIQKDFLSEVAQTINVGIAGPMMGIIQYGDDPVTEISLKSYSNSRDMKSAVEKIVQKGGQSNVGKALSYINKLYFSDTNGNRGGAPNVAVVLVDGWPTDKVEEASRLARESGINIFFVTIEGPDDNEKHNLVEANFVDKAVCRTNGFFSLPVSSWFGLRKAVQPLVKRVCDTDRLVCSKTCLNANDIAFVIDGSSSVGTGNFRTVLQFVANVTREFEISDTDTRVGAVQYTYEQRLEFAFGQYNNKAELLNAIKRINYWSGGTSTGAAITYAAEQLFSKSKPNKRKIMIVITDGRSYDDVRAPSLAVHRQ